VGLVKLEKLSGLDLFSGIGGIGLALDEWVRVVAYCERDKYAQSVLLSRMAERQIASAPIWDDVTTLRGEMLPRIDIIFGGFPCQDISSAGLRAGLAGERSGLFFEIVRLAKETRAPFVFLENVPAIRTRGLREVVGAFAKMGYDSRWTCLSASSLGAPHKRERWFLLAHANGSELRNEQRWSSGKCWQRENESRDNGSAGIMADTDCPGLEGLAETEVSRQWQRQIKTRADSLSNGQFWAVEPNVGRVVNGLPNRVDRIKCLGNSVVPIQAKTAFEKLMGLESDDSVNLL
jgi:DNA (cytosine-5)-methyltransferase 1